MPRSRELAELSTQHESLRTMMDACEDLADRLDARGDVDPMPLTRELARLRLAFDAHNKFEEQLLRPVLLEHDAFGRGRIQRMLQGHIHEHRAIGARLASSATASVRGVLGTLRAHLEEEERHLLSPAPLHGVFSASAPRPSPSRRRIPSRSTG